MSNEIVVRLDAVSKEYGRGHTRVRALKSVDMKIFRGDFAVISGPSGSGKTTLLNIAGGLEPPTRGEVMVDGRNLKHLSVSGLSKLRRDRIGLIFQSHNLFPVLTVMENAEYVMLIQGKPKKERKEKVMAVLEIVGMSGMSDRFPRELSGGERQRVSIARAVAAEPVLILADEPTASIDSVTAVEIMRLMARLNRELGVTFVFASHDPEVITQAGKKYSLKDGIIAKG